MKYCYAMDTGGSVKFPVFHPEKIDESAQANLSFFCEISDEDYDRIAMGEKARFIDGNLIIGPTEIEMLKQFLNDTDYVVIKIAEGVATKEEYAEILQDRQKARDRIRECEEES